MMKALYSGVAGLKTHQGKMDVIGNNIANVNTVAFKASQTTFSDIMYQNSSNAMAPTEKLGGVNAKQVGLGSLTAAIKTTIESAGAAQSTGEAFDIRLSDGNATNFFVVSNGQENLFTRAGSFYIDGAGNLAMTSTGYMVQGWQAVEDSVTGEVTIKKDTVSSLRLLKPENQTSAAEATTDAYASGIVDKRDTNINSTDGYNMSLSFYDSMGYQYSAKYTIKNFDGDAGEYTVKLANIYDSNNVDILKSYINETKAAYLKTGSDYATIEGATGKASGGVSKVPFLLNRTSTKEGVTVTSYTQEYTVKKADGTTEKKTATATATEEKPYIYVYTKKDDLNNDILYAVSMTDEEVNDMLRARVFGSDEATSRNEYQLTSKFSLDDQNNIYCAEQDVTYTFNPHKVTYTGEKTEAYAENPTVANEVFSVTTKNPDTNKDETVYYITFQGSDNTLKAYPLSSIYAGAGGTAIQELMEKKPDNMAMKDQMSFNTKTGALRITYKDVNYKLKFNAEGEGDFEFIGSKGQTAVDFTPNVMGGQFSKINVDFSKMLMSNNGGSCTAAMDNGKVSNPTLGTGRKIGALTGIAVQQNGEIFGSYDNGNTRLLGQIAVAQFANASGLEELGNNLFAETQNSGSFDGIGVVITSDGGKMETGQLEMSNVDLSREFTEMITTQRGFQANSRIITVSDTLLEELTNLKR